MVRPNTIFINFFWVRLYDTFLVFYIVFVKIKFGFEILIKNLEHVTHLKNPYAEHFISLITTQHQASQFII